jgi:phosphomannomutase/phosphoglucomutase
MLKMLKGKVELALALKGKTTLALAMVAVIAMFTIATIVMMPGLISSANSSHVRKTVGHLAVMQAQTLQNQIAQLQSQLHAQLVTEGISALLQQNDASALQQATERLRTANNGAVSVRLVPAGSDYGSLGLRFAEIDLLRKAERGETVYPEAFEEEGQWRFDLVLPLKASGGQVAGSALVVFDVGLLQKSFEQIPSSMAQTLFIQKFDQGKEQAVLRAGGGSSLNNASDVLVSAIPHWKVQVVPGEQLMQEAVVSPRLLFAGQGSVMIFSLLALWIVHKRTQPLSKKTEAAQATPIQIKGARKIDKSSAVQAAAENPPPRRDDFADPLFRDADILDLDDGETFEIRPVAVVQPVSPPKSKKSGNDKLSVPITVFRDYDIRGHADQDLGSELARRIGLAFGSECIEQGQQNVMLAGDGRKSTPRLKAAVCEGLLASGCNVIDLGSVPTPLLYFALSTRKESQSGIMVTASHNPAADNGFKLVINGRTLASDQILRLRDRVQSGDFTEGQGESTQLDIVPHYIDHIAGDIVLAGSYKVVIDCGNGIAGLIAPRLFDELGCQVVPLYCDVDGAFPNHDPDPSVMDNLADLVQKVQSEGADVGIALDGDGDRLAIVTAAGDIILPDRLLMLFAKDIASRNPGTDIIFDVKSTRQLNALISSYGGRPVMWKSGHSHIKNKMLETGALLGGELSGHIFFKERWFGFDDGMYSAARLLEIMSIRDQDLDGIFSAFPVCASTPEIRIAVSEEKKFSIIKRLVEKGEWGNGKLTTIDGARVDFAKGWGLVRASNTSAALTLRFEADDEEMLATVQYVFKQQLQNIDKDLRIPF